MNQADIENMIQRYLDAETSVLRESRSRLTANP